MSQTLVEFLVENLSLLKCLFLDHLFYQDYGDVSIFIYRFEYLSKFIFFMPLQNSAESWVKLPAVASPLYTLSTGCIGLKNRKIVLKYGNFVQKF